MVAEALATASPMDGGEIGVCVPTIRPAVRRAGMDRQSIFIRASSHSRWQAEWTCGSRATAGSSQVGALAQHTFNKNPGFPFGQSNRFEARFESYPRIRDRSSDLKSCPRLVTIGCLLPS